MESRLSLSPRHTILDLLTTPITQEDKNKLIRQYAEKSTLLSPELLESHLSCQPLLLTIFLLLSFLSLALFSLAIFVTVSRFYGRCGGKRYQPHPSSSPRFIFLLLSFLLSWLLLASSSLNFILSAASFWGHRTPTQLVPIPLKSLSLDYPDYDRIKRESILASLFNDPEYEGDFENLEEEVKTTSTTTQSAFIQETTRRNIRIGEREEEREGTRGVTVFLTTNGQIEESGMKGRVELRDNEEDEEEYMEDDEEDTNTPTTKTTVTPTRTTVTPTRTTVSPTRTTVTPTRTTVDTTGLEEDRHRMQRILKGNREDSTAQTAVSHQWMDEIGRGDEWTRLLESTVDERNEGVPVRQEIIRTSTSAERTVSLPTTSRFPARTLITPSPTPSLSLTPSTPSIPRIIHAHPDTFPTFSPFPSQSPPSNSPIPQQSSTHLPIFPPLLPDYMDIKDEESLPIPLGRIEKNKKGGQAGLSLLTHHRPFDSVHSLGFRSLHISLAVFLGLLLSLSTLPTLLIVLIGSMHYARSFHPLDRSKISDRVGVLSVIMGLFLLFLVPLLLFYSSVGLVLSHTHHTLCPLVQRPMESAEEVMLVMEGCARVHSPLILMWQSSLLSAIGAFPVSILLLLLSNYFLRMRSEHYWTHSDSHLI